MIIGTAGHIDHGRTTLATTLHRRDGISRNCHRDRNGDLDGDGAPTWVNRMQARASELARPLIGPGCQNRSQNKIVAASRCASAAMPEVPQ